jgi:hypothetical protein
MKTNITLGLLTAMGLSIGSVSAQTLFYEGFDDMSTFSAAGWVLTNQSSPMGTNSWAQADGTMGAIANSGDTLSYAQSGFEATTSTGSGTISDWMITPIVSMENGDVIRLNALSFNSANFPDRFEVRISTNAGTNVGTMATDVGDFSTLVFDVNPNLDTMSFPSIVSGDTWTEFSGVVSGLPGATDCRIGVRYFVTDGGGTGSNSSTVGCDDLEVYRGTSTVGINEVNEDAVVVNVFPNPTADILTIKTSNLSSNLVRIIDVQGKVAMEENFFSTSTINVRSLEAGTYIVEVVDTASGVSIRERIQKL